MVLGHVMKAAGVDLAKMVKGKIEKIVRHQMKQHSIPEESIALNIRYVEGVMRVLVYNGSKFVAELTDKQIEKIITE